MAGMTRNENLLDCNTPFWLLFIKSLRFDKDFFKEDSQVDDKNVVNIVLFLFN